MINCYAPLFAVTVTRHTVEACELHDADKDICFLRDVLLATNTRVTHYTGWVNKATRSADCWFWLSFVVFLCYLAIH